MIDDDPEYDGGTMIGLEPPLEPPLRIRISSGEYAGMAFIAFFGAVILVAYQFMLWLKYGHWTPYNLHNLFVWLKLKEPDVTWKGLEKIILFLLQCPLSAAIVGLGFIFGGLSSIEDEKEKELARVQK